MFALGPDPTTTTSVPSLEGTGFGDVVVSILFISIAAIPIAVSVWALIDVARRPRWAWAMADRAQVVWLALILFGILILPLGLVVAPWYLIRVRPTIERAESGSG